MAQDAHDVKTDLCNYLEVIGSGRCATSGLLPNASNPGLFVHSIGKIGLPLSDRDAVALASIAHEAPFGKGSETFVDPTVRKTWELNPNQFEIRNPAWTSTLQEAVGRVVRELGFMNGAPSVRPQLHRLLLYEPGAFFEKHRDTEKAPGMFSTLVIALPSEHTGGDVTVQNGDDTHTLQTQGLCDFGYSYLAWYADVAHSVSKVKSGYRLVLTYNLMQQDYRAGHIPSAMDDHKQNLKEVLALWNRQLREQFSGQNNDCTWEKLLYILDHEYSEANISTNQLKGKDQLRMRYLSDACCEHDFVLYFAHLQFSQFGSVDEDEDNPYWAAGLDVHDFVEKLESTWTLKTVFQSDGQELAKGIELEDEEDEGKIINRPDVEDLEPDNEECDGWTGNEGCTATHFYYRTCAVVLPRTERLDFLAEAESLDVQVYVNSLLDEMQRQDLESKSKEELRKFCEKVVDAKKSPEKPKDKSADLTSHMESWRHGEPKIKPLSRVSDGGLGAIVLAALKLDIPELAEAAVGVVKQSLPSALFSKIGKHLAEQETTAAWPHWSVVNNLLGIELKEEMFRTRQFAERARGLECFINAYRGITNVSAAVIQDISLEMANGLVQTARGDVIMTAEDAKTIVQLSETYGDKFAAQKLLPLAKKNVDNVDFIFPLLRELSSGSQASPLPIDNRRKLFKNLVGDVIPTIPSRCQSVGEHQQREENPKRCRFDWDGDRDRRKRQLSKDHTTRTITSEQLWALFSQCETLDLHHEIDSLCNTVVELASSAETKTFQTLLLPLLRWLLPSSLSSARHSAHYGSLFRAVISSYLRTYVRTSTNELNSWRCLPRGCRDECHMCKTLDSFLTNPDKQVARFTELAHVRTHMEKQLRKSRCKTLTVKDRLPHTLIVDKTIEEREEALKGWRQRCESARKAIEAIGLDKIGRLLGEGWEDSVGFSLLHTRPDGAEARRPLGNLGQGTAPTATHGSEAKIREGANVIDLTL
ncbi:MAG: hypothetical protein Q9209_001644 [Squamulea sp. 1 TL-2023]